MVTAHGVTKKFGNTIALENISLTVNPGEFVFLTGPSGSGKTTFLRLLMREFSSDSGSLVVNNQDLKTMKSKLLPSFRRNIGVVYQDFKLLSDLNMAENVALPLAVRGIKSVDINHAVQIALDMVGLGSKSKFFPGQLSGGELQRAGLARAVVGRPQLLLADEPTGNLDPKTARDIVKLLKEIHSRLNTTVIMATHNSEIVNHYGLRVIALEKGHLIKDDQKGKYD